MVLQIPGLVCFIYFYWLVWLSDFYLKFIMEVMKVNNTALFCLFGGRKTYLS